MKGGESAMERPLFWIVYLAASGFYIAEGSLQSEWNRFFMEML
jgi:hypothetical protein